LKKYVATAAFSPSPRPCGNSRLRPEPMSMWRRPPRPSKPGRSPAPRANHSAQ
jgi:hypothetical protein